MSSTCALAWCRSQTDGDKKSGGFFRLPSLAKQREYRGLVVEGAGLPEIYKEKEGDFRLCFRHYKETDFDTKGQRLKLKKGIIEPICKLSQSSALLSRQENELCCYFPEKEAEIEQRFFKGELNIYCH